MFLTELALYSSSHRLRIEGGLVLYIRCNGALAPTLLLAVWLHTSRTAPRSPQRGLADVDVNLPEVKEAVSGPRLAANRARCH